LKSLLRRLQLHSKLTEKKLTLSFLLRGKKNPTRKTATDTFLPSTAAFRLSLLPHHFHKMADAAAAALAEEKRTLSKKLGESLKKSFTPRSSRGSTPADLSAANTPKAGASASSSASALSGSAAPAGSSSPRDAKAAAKAAKDAVSKKASAAAADAKAAATKASKNVQKAAKDTRAKLEADNNKGFKVIGATLVAAAAAVAGFFLYKEHEKKSKPEPVPAKKGFSFGKK